MRVSTLLFFLFILSCGDDAQLREVETVDGVKVLRTKTFYESGKIKSDGLLLERSDTFLPHGYIKRYRKNGSIESLHNYRYGTLVGSSYLFDNDSNVITYAFYDPIGRLIYRSTYDKHGILSTEEGGGQIEPVIVIEGEDDEPIRSIDVYTVSLPFLSKSVIASSSSNNGDTLLHISNLDGDMLKVNLDYPLDSIILTVIYSRGDTVYRQSSSTVIF